MRKTTSLLRAVTRGLFLPVILILVFQAAGSRMLSIPERDVPIPELRQLSSQIGTWKAGLEQTLETNVAEYLKPDDYIIRNYANESATSNINLFVAHFKSLQDSYGPHSPRVCLPGAGWLVRSSKIETVPVLGRAEGIPVNEYTLEKFGERIFVVYWYQNNRAIWADEVQAKLKLLPDLIRYRRSDVSLVRLVTNIRSATAEKERSEVLEFTKILYPSLVERFGAAK